ncbi:hypothetical protein Tco_1563653 [Tanacetum coccineum]
MSEDEIRKNMEHEYMEQVLIEEEEKWIATEKANKKEFDEEAVRFTLEEKARYEKLDQDRSMEEEEFEYNQQWYNHILTPQKSVVDRGEPGWRLNEDAPAPPVVTMDDTGTMAQLLEAPTVGYEDAIVVPEITVDNFELKHGLLTLVQNKQFFGHDKEDPHAHIRYFNKITSTMKFPNVPSTSVKLMLFSFSLEGATRIWLEKEPPRSILTWDDLVSKFINIFSLLPKQQIFEMKSRDFNNDLMKLSTKHGTDSMIFFEHAHIMDFRSYINSILSIML